MHDVIFIGDGPDARIFTDAGIPSFAPAPACLAERVTAEMRRCRVLAMTEDTFAALPDDLRRALREGSAARVVLVPRMRGDTSRPDTAEAPDVMEGVLEQVERLYA